MFHLFDGNKSKVIDKEESAEFVIVGFPGGGLIPDFENIDHFELFCIRGPKAVKKQMLRFPENADTNERIRMMKELSADAVIAAKFLSRDLAQLKEAGIRAYTFDGGPGAAIRDYRKGLLKSIY
ncbi:MAG: hypothetical protein PUB14_02105 [Lachnospiraceae bacterium]|nr:hypothetical protein [Lachnospiraceae bacterium]